MVNNTINNITEIWKPLDEFPQYSVSNIGRIKNNKTGYVLVGGYDRDKYRQVTITCNGKQYNRRVCRLVAIAFVPNPNNLPQVNHKDENKENDLWTNLEWCTAEYNVNYGSRNDKTRKKVRCVETNIIYSGFRTAERLLGIPHSNIGKAIKRGTKAGGFHWELV